jgi:ABC-2 type transport system ATP-binding protein
MLEVKGVFKYYGPLPAVRDVSFVARPGEVLGYLGPNGSGKSTTVKMIVGLLTPSRGTICYNGRDVRDGLLEYRRRVGYVPESADLYSYLSGAEYLMLVGRLRRIPTRTLEDKVERFLTLLDIEDDRDAPISAYSKGMKQKILISAALLHNPEVVVLDEPSSGLDAGSHLVLRELVRALAADGRVVLYSSHDLDVVEETCSSVVILRCGEVVAADSVERLRDLMQKPSLEQVFTELAIRKNLRGVAADLLEAMKL